MELAQILIAINLWCTSKFNERSIISVTRCNTTVLECWVDAERRADNNLAKCFLKEFKSK